MQLYQINYDLHKQHDYDALYQKIKSYNAWATPLQSCWIVLTDKTATEMRNELSATMDAEDGLLITALSGHAAWKNLYIESNHALTEWINDHLSAEGNLNASQH